MKHFDPEHGERVMAHLDGEGYNDTFAALDDAVLRELHALREVHDALHAEGGAVAIPVVDLWAGISEKLDTALDDDPRLVSSLMELGDAFRLGVPHANLFDGAPADMVDDVPLEMEAALEAAVEYSHAPELLVDLWTPLSRSLPEEDEAPVEPALEAALFALGADIARNAPESGIWESLQRRPEMDGAPGHVPTEVTTRNIVPFPVERQREEAAGPVRWLKFVATVAAAGLLVLAGYSLRSAEETAAPTQQQAAGAPAPDVDDKLQLAGARDVGRSEGTMTLRDPVPGGTPPRPRDASKVRPRPVTLQEVVNEYRNNADDLSKFGVWASLSREEAAALLEQSGLSREAIIGAAQFLPAEEALAVLQAAVDNAPEDAYLRYALANRYGETDDVAGYQRALNEWREADPQNALPYYLQAQMMMAAGDMAGGTATINAGTQLAGASTYGAESARYQASALEAAGRDRDAARYLAAATAGDDECQALQRVSNDLLDQARMLEDSGNVEAAADLYDAVRVLGEQVMASADVPQIQLVALEIQQTAVSAMMGLQEVWTPDTVAALAQMADAVMEGIEELTGLLGDLTSFLTSDNMQQVLDITNTILGGDVNSLLNVTGQ